MNAHVNQMNLRLIRNTDPSTAYHIRLLHEDNIIEDYSDDGWVLKNREWIPYTTFCRKLNNEEANNCT